MPLGKGRRKLALILGFIVAGLTTTWVSCPLWFPWVLRPLASRMDARFASYERLGYSRFALHDFSFTNRSVVIRAQQVEAYVPSVWLGRLAMAQKTGPISFLRVTNWNCRLLSNDEPPTPIPSQVNDVAEALGTIRKWVPTASLFGGNVEEDDLQFGIAHAVWTGRKLQADLKLPRQASGEILNVALNLARPFELEIMSASQGVDSTFTVATNRMGLDVRGVTFWQSNRVDLQAHFDPSDSLPRTGELQASNFRFPAALVKLPGYHQVSGSLSAQWQNPHFLLSLTAAARPAIVETNLPPIDVELRARGDTNSVTFDKFTLQLPFLAAHLSNELTLVRSKPFLQGSATLNLSADLGQQRWMSLAGKLEGQADLGATPGGLPKVQLYLTGTNVGNQFVTARSLSLKANLDWPIVEVSGINFGFDDGSACQLNGVFDVKQNLITTGQFDFAGPLVQRWLPAGYSYNSLSITGQVQGPLRSLAHSGQAVVRGVSTPMLKPCEFDLHWKGESQNIHEFELQLQETNCSANVGGALTVTPEQLQLRLSRLGLVTNSLTALQLAEPASITFVPPRAGTAWKLEATPIRWAGPAGELAAEAAIQWPTQGAVRLSVQSLPLQTVAEFTPKEIPQVDIRQILASANWSNGPAVFELEAAGKVLPQPLPGGAETTRQGPSPATLQSKGEEILATPLNFEFKLVGDQRGLSLSNLVVNTATSSVAVVSGFLPLTLHPSGPTNFFEIGSEESLNLKASVRPEAFFWERLAELSGLRVENPILDLHLYGTWRAPGGKLSFQVQNILFKEANSLPVSLQNLHLELSLDRDRARLTQGQLLVQGQTVSLTGELPLGENTWAGLLHKELPDWQQASARLRIDNARFAAFEPLFPQLLAPEGDFNVDLQLQRGFQLEGAVTLRHARTRPLGNIAPFRDINVTLRFQNRLLTLESATANLSGAEIDLSGKMDLQGTNWLSQGLPPFSLAMHGTNVPLAREPEYIIRSDLDLAITKTNGAPPLVFGKARLRDSFCLSDLSDLVPGKVASPSSRPPYFSIDNPFLANWRLAVTVEGVRWLKVRTSLFNGEVSANLNLQGILKEPLILGGLSVESGLVRFPFANLQVQQGLVTLASQDPYHPQLLVRASSKQFGYDIHMEVTGPVDAPVIQFTSSPPLSSEQILLMITAGQLPPGAYTLTAQQRAQTVALFLGRDLLAKLGMGDVSQERLTVSSGEEISDQGRPTYRVEYKLTDRWSVQGEYDRFGDFNADFKWRIYSK